MAERSVLVRLRAEVGDYVRGMTQAKKATDEVGSAAPRAQSSLQKMVQSARDNREAWTTAGTALAGFGAAIVGVGVAALKTGIEYNTLQQTSRAALTTLTGSAEAANAQMDKLDAFARTSPFAKSVFIQAQQQMLGFGIEAGKVIPYLDAIQNAVAATGGSNQDIAELTRIFSQVQAAAKITAVDLMQFGQRGVNAAELIGSQMGMTGAQVREAITSGSIDAGKALDALAAGMQERFGGAADNVKDTFAGSMDRVKAAWRDLSSELASGLVDPQGGGGLVDWLNGIADAMRRFQAAPDWVRGGTAAIAGLVGVGSLLAGTAMLVIPRMVSLYDALGQLGPVGLKAQAGMKGFAGALPAVGKIAGVAAAIGVLASATGELIDAITQGEAAPQANEIARGIRNVAESGGDLYKMNFLLENTGTVLGAAKVEADTLTKAFDQLLNPSVTDRVAGFFDGIPGVTGYMETLADRVGSLDSQLAALLTSGETEAVEAFLDSMRRAGYSTEEINALLPQTKDALIGVEDAAAGADEAVTGTGGAFDYTTGKVRDHTTALQEMIDKQREAAGVVLSQRDANRRFEEAVAKATETIKENGRTLDITTEKGRANEAALDGIVDAGWKAVDSARAHGASQRDLQPIMQRTRDEFIRAAESAGMARADAKRLADQLGLIPAYVGTKVTVDTLAAHAAIDALRAKASASIQMRVNVNENYVPARSPNQIMRADGGSVFGPGTSTSDSIPALLSNGEHVLSAREVIGLGGHGEVERLRALARKGAQAFATGGAVTPRLMPAYAAGGRVQSAPAAAGFSGPLVQVGQVVQGSAQDVGQEVKWALIGRGL